MYSDPFFYTSSDDEDEVNSELAFFTKACGKVEIFPLMKCTSVIRQMAYGSPDAHLQMGATTASQSLVAFCTVVMELYGEEFSRNPTYIDIEKLYPRHDEKHGFLEMIVSIDCTGWHWENCPIALKAQFCRSDHEPDPFTLLEAIAS
ncbi:ALP1-like protein [Tanacetum coccineum]